MSPEAFGALVLGVPLVLLGAVVLSTAGAAPEAVTAGRWVGGVLFTLALLVVIARRGRV